MRSLARLIEARFEAIAEKEQNIKVKADATLSLPIEEVSHVDKGPLDASEDTLLSLRRPVDEVSSVIDDVFDIDESNVEGMQVRDKFAEFFEDKGSVEKVLSATKLPEGGNSRSAYSLYHLKEKKRKKSVGCDSGKRDCALFGASISALFNPGPGSFAHRRIWDQECFSRQHLEGKVVLKE
ncbi:hypothetical protein Tco_0939762 [Tanacetum coccineum]|uniref:Uncharacterized protein n=1 Tax=Tanacetum coccineum TaxID=301880 RepID=A0ABQ5DLH9_9ASTR